MTEQNNSQTASAPAPVYLELKKVMAGPDSPGGRDSLIFVFEDEHQRVYYTRLMVQSCYQKTTLKALKRLTPQPPPEKPEDPDDNGAPNDNGAANAGRG
ncbi:MAG: hypothetical protein PHV00_06075 [Syntrophales bacterium]|jgi:hypothetical protein|nr:hypothetical protein [Dehalococcoidia bacterium]MDD4339231.1 hypothetical protein [Syntrophales bacterium]